MLFACLQGQTVSLIALCINRDTNQTAWHIAFEGIAGRHVTSVRATKTQWYAKTLAVTDDDVCAPLARWRNQSQRQQVSSGNHHRAFSVQRGSIFAVVANIAIHAWVLQ